MRKFTLVAVIILVSCFGSIINTSAQSATSFNNQVIIPVATTLENPCAEEEIDFIGDIHIGFHGVINNNKMSLHVHVNSQGLSGVGQISGNTYNSNTVSNFSSNQNFNGASEQTIIENAVFTSPGKDNNFLAKITIHMTINANGETTAEVVSIKSACK